MFNRTTRAAAGVSLVATVLCAALFARPARDAGKDVGDTKPSPLRSWVPNRDTPPHVSSDKTVKLDYPIVYVRVPRPYPKTYSGINHLNQAGLHQTNAPGAELRLLRPDGKDECLVPVKPHESITDPAVSFDGQWVYFAKFHEMAVGEAHMSRLRSRKGADVYKVHVPTRRVVKLTSQQRTPNTGAVPAGTESHPHGVHNLGPCPVSAASASRPSQRYSSSSWMTTVATSN